MITPGISLKSGLHAYKKIQGYSQAPNFGRVIPSSHRQATGLGRFNHTIP